MKYIHGIGNTLCRKEFLLDKEVDTAVATLMAEPHSYAYPAMMHLPDQPHNWLLGGSFLKFRFHLNGELVGVGPVRPVVTENVVVTRFDLKPFLRQGANVAGVLFRGECHGLAIQITLRLTDGSIQEIDPVSGWKTLDGNGIYAAFCYGRPALSFYRGGFGPGEQPEHIDGERYPHGWLQPGYDDSLWSHARASIADFHSEESTVPAYVQTRLTPVSVVRTDRGFVADFGRHIAGGIELYCPEAAQIELRLGEELLEDGRVRFQMRTGNCYQEGWTYPAGGATLAHFGLRSFRYAEILGYPGELTGEHISALALNAPFREEDSRFDCADERLNQVWDLCKNSVKYTTLDVYMDCPSRERMAYEADTYINMLTHFAVESNTATARRTILYQMEHYTWPCEWRLFMAPVVLEYFMHTADMVLVKTVYERLVEECSFHTLLQDGLVENFPMTTIVDWPLSCRDGYEFGPGNTVPNLFVYWSLNALAALAGYVGKPGDARYFREIAAEVKQAVNARLIDPASGLLVDHLNSSHSAFHSSMFALAFDALEEGHIPTALDFIDRSGMKCSVYGAQFYLDALFKHGRAERAVQLMTASGERGWLHMIEMGATTATEAWNPELKPNMSMVHPWGSAPANVIVRHLFGLRPQEPGWKKYRFEPNPGGIAKAQLELVVPGGKIHARFQVKDGQLRSECRCTDG